MMGFWRAGLADGREMTELSPELKAPDRSPWRALEALGIPILWAEQNIGEHFVCLQAKGCPLLCGKQYFTTLSLDGGSPTTRVYRFVRRQEKQHSIWAVIGEGCVGTFVAPPEQMECPDPQAVEE
jgi:hypothetical protein